MRPRSQLASIAGISTALALSATAGVARADAVAATPGFAIDRYAPADPGGRWLALDSVSHHGEVRPALGVILGFATPLQRQATSRSGTVSIVENQLTAHLGAAVTLLGAARLSLALPVVAAQGGTTVALKSATYAAPSGAGVGDLRIGLDARFAGEPDGPFRIGAGARLWAPTGSQAAYTSDGGVRFEPHVDVAGTSGAVEWAFRLGYLVRTQHEVYAATTVGDELAFGAGGAWRFARGARVGAELFGDASATKIAGQSTTNDTALALLAEGALDRGDFSFGLGAGPGLGNAAGNAAFRALASVSWAPTFAKPAPPPPPDRDHDGVTDLKDTCPDVAGVADANPMKNGCPPDEDSDGIPDAVDACPAASGVASADARKNGCPVDRDGDGVPDLKDACPDEIGDTSPDARLHGCPADADHDGIRDVLDACPDAPGMPSDDPARSGCPGDRDGDGVRDDLDACPDVAGKPSEDKKKNGCPTAALIDGQIRLFERIEFADGRAEVPRDAGPVLDAIVAVLRAHPEVQRVRVEAHTEAGADPAKNKFLSFLRAQAVVAALRQRGVAQGVLTAEGLGQEVPLEPNTTEAGRRANRRLELHVVATGEAKPAGRDVDLDQ